MRAKMLKPAIIPVVLLFPTASLAADTSLDLRCTPQPTGAPPDPIPIASVEVSVNGHNWLVTHVAASGARYDRSAQYRLHDVPNAATPTWEGVNIKRPNLKMIGRLSPAGAGAFLYIETIFDAKQGGAQTFEQKASCAPSQAQTQQPAAAPQPAQEPQQTAQASAGNDCRSIADKEQRLNCYDKAYGVTAPASRPTPEEPKPAASAQAPASEPAPAALGEKDLDVMHETFEKNQARFVRDYVGKEFKSPMVVNRVVQNPNLAGRVTVNLGPDGHGVACLVEDKETVDYITTINKGDKVAVTGRVSDHTSGNVDLSPCRVAPIR